MNDTLMGPQQRPLKAVQFHRAGRKAENQRVMAKTNLIKRIKRNERVPRRFTSVPHRFHAVICHPWGDIMTLERIPNARTQQKLIPR